MELIEFLQHTDHRNLKYNIGHLVKQRLRELEENLQEKRWRLWKILKYESLIYDEELSLFMREKLEENVRKRHEWLGVNRIEKQLEEEKFLKLKKLQRELENCEEIRHLQSKQILMETKQAQLHQIEEKKAIREEEQRIEQMWLETMQRLNKEKEKQEMYERKLCELIAKSNQAKNLQQQKEKDMENKRQAAALQKEYAEDDLRAAWADTLSRYSEKEYEESKKLKQGEILRNQITENRLNHEYQRKFDIETDLKLNNQSHMEILKETKEKEQQKMQNSIWWQHYMEYIRNEKKSKHERDQQMDNMFLDTECVLKQRNKKPYNKTVR